MSYARFGEYDSDVYVFMNCGGFLECCSCGIVGGCFKVFSTREMLNHLEQHIKNGDIVPDFTLKELQQDDKENFNEES